MLIVLPDANQFKDAFIKAQQDNEALFGKKEETTEEKPAEEKKEETTS